jgi:hypothetical protein
MFDVPGTVGVPDIVAPVNVKPGGKFSADQVKGAVPPFAVSVWL